MRISRLLTVLGLIGAAVALAPSGPAQATTPASAVLGNIGDDFTPVQLGDGSSWAPNGRASFDRVHGLELVYQADGNLVLYYIPSMTPLWASNTIGSSMFIDQHDGNAVIYDAHQRPMWNSGTASQTDSQRILALDWNGQLVVVHPNGDVLYRSGSRLPTGSGALVGTGPFHCGCGGPTDYYAMQGDGNLVERDFNGKALWASATFGHPGAYAVLQTDLNLVIYAQGRALFSTRTSQADCQNRCNTPVIEISSAGEMVLQSRPHAVRLWSSWSGRA